MPLVELDQVEKTFRVQGGHVVTALRRVNFHIERGETVALIGESGSGKSTIGKLVLGLLRPDSGAVRFDGHDLSKLSASEVRRLRRRMQVVFQQPYESMNPVLTIGENIEEPLVNYERQLSSRQRSNKVAEALDHVGLPANYADREPSELSGGELQRAAIARAIINRPEMIVLDEPTSSLDLSVRASVLLLLRDLQRELQLTYLFISHDITTVSFVSRRVVVLYMGVVVEEGPQDQVMTAPSHPYTQMLLGAFLSTSPSKRRPPMLAREEPAPSGHSECVFFPRCWRAAEVCTGRPIELLRIGSDRSARCARLEPAATETGPALV
ncbi:MAG TPA: ABC transporter ATP-binding protein [Candidatus Micrarchaeaceae archaeon]|nr:ABC transporter ATP-binding protein [Candidatus Micrarchaeaceae archaeon]